MVRSRSVSVSFAAASFRPAPARRVALLASLALATLLGACDKGLAGPLTPDFNGVWDVTYDDSIDVTLQVADDAFARDTLAHQGGQLTIGDASATTELAIDCARTDLLCPSEVWPREYLLQSAPGELDAEGVQLSKSLVGRGKGACAALPGSVISGEVTAVANASAVRPDAVALTSGRVRIVVDGRCVASDGLLPAGARVVLVSGFTAAKR